MKTIKVSISHTGRLAQVVRVPGGTLTVKPNDRLKGVDILPLSPEQVEHYAARGVRFSGKAVPKSEEDDDDARSKAEIRVLEKAVAKARATLDDAQKDGDLDKIADAQENLAKAEDALAAARGGA